MVSGLHCCWVCVEAEHHGGKAWRSKAVLIVAGIRVRKTDRQMDRKTEIHAERQTK
jgi:hypothetical protein